MSLSYVILSSYIPQNLVQNLNSLSHLQTPTGPCRPFLLPSYSTFLQAHFSLPDLLPRPRRCQSGSSTRAFVHTTSTDRQVMYLDGGLAGASCHSDLGFESHLLQKTFLNLKGSHSTIP